MSEKFEKNLSENEDDPDVYESSGDEWNEDKPGKKRGNRRTSQRLSKKPRVSHIELSSDDEEKKKKKSNNGVNEEKKAEKTAEPAEDAEDVEDEEEDEEEEDDDSNDGSDSSKNPRKTAPAGGKISGTDYVNGGFLILKKDAQSGDASKPPCLWRIDGKALLQKYEVFEEEGLMKHRNTSIYTGWSPLDKDLYNPVTVKVLQHQGQNMTVELNWEKLKDADNESE